MLLIFGIGMIYDFWYVFDVGVWVVCVVMYCMEVDVFC